MSERLGSLHIVRHGKAQQEYTDAASLASLSEAQFRAKIRELNMKQALDELGNTQADQLGGYLFAELDGVKPMVITGPFLRHTQTAEAALAPRHFPDGVMQPDVSAEELAALQEDLRERSRGRVDPSVMRSEIMKTEMPAEHRAKSKYPATWRPGRIGYPDNPDAWGEDYPMVNERVKRVFNRINALRAAGQPAIFFTSGEVSLASMHVSGFGALTDADFLNGITTPGGLHLSGTQFENGGVVSYYDPNNEGYYTHMRIAQPDWSAAPPYQAGIRTEMFPIEGRQ